MLEFDAAGRPVRWESVTESEWDEQSRSEILALAEFRKLTCSGCGGWLPETTALDAKDWIIDPPHRCSRCTALGLRQDAHGKDHSHPEALRWAARRR